MASAATIFSPILNVPSTTIAQFVGKVNSALSVTLETTPSNTVPQLTKGIGSAQSFKQTGRYRIFAYVALIRPSSKKANRNGNFGPLKVTWNDGNMSHSHFIGWNGNAPLDGYGSELPFPGNIMGAKGATAGGHFMFVAAPGTTVSVTSPYFGDPQYTVNIALETF
jgi:hypothetical protein